MQSTVSGYLFELKKKHYDDLPDYNKGRLHGSISANLFWVGTSVAYMLFGVFISRRFVGNDNFHSNFGDVNALLVNRTIPWFTNPSGCVGIAKFYYQTGGGRFHGGG